MALATRLTCSIVLSLYQVCHLSKQHDTPERSPWSILLVEVYEG